MFYYLEGIVAHIDINLAVIDVNGVGYACSTTNNTLSRLKKGSKAKLYTFLSVKEDGIDLFGFYTQEELNYFKLLLSVSGVGPKAALSILSQVDPAGFALAVISDDEKTLTAAQGIGKKIAQRIILELKDKIKKLSYELPSNEVISSTGRANSHVQEASAALAVLGYSQQEIGVAIKSVNCEGLSTEEIVRKVLKALSM